MAANQKDESALIAYVKSQFAWLEKYPDHASYVILCLQRSTYDKFTRQFINVVFENSKKRIASLIGTDDSDTAFQVHTLVLGALVLAVTEGVELYERYKKECIAATAKLVATGK